MGVHSWHTSQRGIYPLNHSGTSSQMHPANHQRSHEPSHSLLHLKHETKVVTVKTKIID